MTPDVEIRLKGLPVSPGISMGMLRVEARGCPAPQLRSITPEEIPHEWDRFEAALQRTEEELNSLRDRIQKISGDMEAAIFDAQVLFLRDSMVMKTLHKEFDRRMQNMESVYYAVVQNFMEAMRHVDDPYLRSRVTDMEDVLQRVLRNMAPARTAASAAVEEAHLLAAYDLTPSDTADLDTTCVLGFVTEVGSAVSHTAILARSLGLPALVDIPQLMLKVTTGQQVVLDGYSGQLILNPTESTIKHYKQLQAEKAKAYQALVEMKDLPSETRDGRRIRLAANVQFSHEFNAIARCGAEGVGLYRTEFFLLDGSSKLPDEEAQYRHYRELVEKCAPHEVVFRTLDSGGDKLPFESGDSEEDNPFLGWRGIRVSLSRPEIFKQQLRAIMRASAHGCAAVMFPMVSGVTEVKEIRAIIDECRAELRARGEAFDEHMRIGVMIEVPSAAMMANVLTRYVDFFSIGTNDLTQYTIAVDRVNYRVAQMFRPTHPGVVRLISHTIEAGIPTAICGEMGGNLSLVPLLVGLGASEISVGTHRLPLIRFAIRHLDYEECRQMAQQALQASDSKTIRALSKALALKSYPSLFD